MSDFGLAHMKGEDAPIHPDDTEHSWTSHEKYMEQAEAYFLHYGMTAELEQFKKDNG